MAEYVTSTEAARGCGYRKPGVTGVGVYLVGPGTSTPCGRLPFPLRACPCCGGGIKPARSWTWIEPATLFAPSQEPRCSLPAADCGKCPLGGALPFGRHGLIWIGEKFYDTPESFMREASMMGVSRKIGALPRGFVLGETLVYLAHRKAAFGGWVCEAHGSDPKYSVLGKPTPERCCDSADALMEPGVFTVFKPAGIDLVVHDLEDVPDRAERLAERIEKDGSGEVRIVKVHRQAQEEMPEETQPEAQT